MKLKTKRFLSFAISIILFLCTVSLGAVFASKYDNTQNKENFNDFSNDLVDMLSEYNPKNTEEACAVSTDSEKTEEIELFDDFTKSDFNLKRLIVKAKGNIEDFDAIAKVEGYDDLHIFQYATEEEAISAYEQFTKIVKVEFVEPDMVLEETETSETVLSSGEKDLQENRSWGVKAMGTDEYNEYLSETIGEENLPQIIVAVIDIGITPDIKPFNGIYNEKSNPNGRILDNGKDFSGEDSLYEYTIGHGTMVAGIISDLTLSNVKILPIKLGELISLNSTLNLYLGIQYAIENGADVINISLGLPGSSALISSVIKLADKKNIPTVIAAGNRDTDCAVTYPANVGAGITVAACDEMMRRASWSAYGRRIDFIAPGVKVSVPAERNNEEVIYAKADGTSFAAPHITALIAILKSENPDMTLDEAYDILKKNAVDLGKGGFDVYCGNGMPCLSNLLLDDTYNLEFSKKTGTYIKPFKLEIKSAGSNMKIFFTVDGTVPDKTKSEYTGPIDIERSCQVRAVAVNQSGDKCGVEQKCDFKITGTEPIYSFEIDENGTITNIYGIIPSEIVIPSELDGKTVNAIGSMVFSDTDITSLTAPQTVKTIGDFALYGCGELKKISVPGLEILGKGVFFSCGSLKEVNFPNVSIIESGTFARCSNLEKIDFASAEKIYPKAFYTCSSLKDVNMSEVQEIYDEAFFLCSKLEKIEFPQLKMLGGDAFGMCLLLKEVSLPLAEEIKSGAFEACFLLSEVNLPCVKRIWSRTFSSCYSLKNANIPVVEGIYSEAFSNCRIMKSIRLPETLKTIGFFAVGYNNGITGEHSKVEGFTIYGEPGSKAEEYADKNEITFIDYNSDYEEKEMTFFEKIKIKIIEVLIETFAPVFGSIVGKII